MEAMAMELPVISTNWSGLTEFMSEEVAYPLAIDGLVTVEPGSGSFSAFEGQRWAQPSEKHLRELLRRVVDRPSEARERGRAARRMVVERFTPATLARAVERHVRRIQGIAAARAAAAKGWGGGGGGGGGGGAGGGGGGNKSGVPLITAIDPEDARRRRSG